MGIGDVAEIGRLLGDQTRVRLLDGLFDGRAHTVTELAHHVGVSTSTASEHLSRLLDGGLVTVEPRGRHRYYQLHGPPVADLLESLFEFGNNTPVKRALHPDGMAFARTCYDHLAGTVAVGLYARLVETGSITIADSAPVLTASGHRAFEQFGLVPQSRPARRPLVRGCLDWSERRPHLAGAVPAALLEYMLTEKWFVRSPLVRTLRITDTGRHGLYSAFGYQPP